MEDAVNFGPKYPIIQYCVAVDDKFCYMDTLGIGLCACILSEAGASTRYLSRVYLQFAVNHYDLSECFKMKRL